jgi:hypothetical protein
VLIDLLQRTLPTLYQRLLVRGLQRRRQRMLARRSA